MNHKVICSERCPLLLNPIETSEYADEGLYGMTVNLLFSDQGYDYVETEYGYKGYIRKDHLKDDREDWSTRRNALVISPSGDVMPTPSYRGMPLMTLHRGCFVEAKDEDPVLGWTEVKLLSGEIGFMRELWIRRLSSWQVERTISELRDAVVEDAKLYLNTIYKWGGKTPLGIDCSGLTFMAYWLNGMRIFRDARIEEGFAIQEISKEALQKGDLLFYKGHVTLYLGNQYYINSRGSQGGVVIQSLDPDSPLYDGICSDELLAVGSYFSDLEGMHAY